tara:strand:+ start:2288 stop:2485 length:198 start_codon:yes stop_codon:yes gene_type:complete
MKDEIKDALIKKYEGEKATAHTNIRIYLLNPTGIGDHSDVMAMIDEQIGKAALADEKLNYIKGVR